MGALLAPMLTGEPLPSALRLHSMPCSLRCPVWKYQPHVTCSPTKVAGSTSWLERRSTFISATASTMVGSISSAGCAMQEHITCAGVESQLGRVHQGDAPLQLQSPVPGVTLPQYQPDPSRPATQPASRSAAESSNGAAPSHASPGSTDSTIDRQATQHKQAAEKEQSQSGPTASKASSEHKAGDGSVASDGKVRLFLDRQRFHQQTLQLAQRLDKPTCTLGPYSSICPTACAFLGINVESGPSNANHVWQSYTHVCRVPTHQVLFGMCVRTPTPAC